MIQEDEEYGYRNRVLFNISQSLVFLVHQESKQDNFILKKCQIPEEDGEYEQVIPYQEFIIFLDYTSSLKIFMIADEFKLLEVSRINLPFRCDIKLDDYEPDCLIA